MAQTLKLSHGEYTVGWVCALPVELTAALEMLDVEHQSLPRHISDYNRYRLGSIAGHNVVVVMTFDTGNSAAASVTTQMRMSFPNIRYGLLVGIGGGVPTLTDNGYIRLGHVVVSKPTGGHSGAIQYDSGKAEAGQFQRKGILAPPADILLAAANDYQAERSRNWTDAILENVARIDTTIPGLRSFSRPSPETDHHLTSEDGRRAEVTIHRGTIASGSLVIRNAAERDRLAEQGDCLCFETEAAGALVALPCMVIRGISDYCDELKNDTWHGFAAAVAAAYARQLFFHMDVVASQ